MKPNNPKYLVNPLLVEDGRYIVKKHAPEQKPQELSVFEFAWIDDKLTELQNRQQEECVGFDWDDMHDLFRDIAKHFYELGYETRR